MFEFLKEKGGLAVLSDPDVEMATREILANGRSRPQITKDIRRKVPPNMFGERCSMFSGMPDICGTTILERAEYKAQKNVRWNVHR